VDEARDALRLAGTGYPRGAGRVDLLVGLRVELRRRVVRQPGEMDDGVTAVEHGRIEGADVALHELDLVAHLAEPLLPEIELVEDAHRLALVEQLADRDAADVACSAWDGNQVRSSVGR